MPPKPTKSPVTVKSARVLMTDQLREWRREFQELHESVMQHRADLEAWFEQAALLEAEIEDETDEIRECVADIKQEKKRCREIYRQVPNPKEFSVRELKNRTGKASTLYDVVKKVFQMNRDLSLKVEKLAYLLKHPIQ
jgi:septal ring factor EnvC (AmiA/AmiB activator)